MEKITMKENVYQNYGLETGYRMGYQISPYPMGNVQESSRQQVQTPSLRHKKTTLNFGRS